MKLRYLKWRGGEGGERKVINNFSVIKIWRKKIIMKIWRKEGELYIYMCISDYFYNRERSGGIYIYIYTNICISDYFYNKHTAIILEALDFLEKPTAGAKDSSGCVTRFTLFRPSTGT